MKSVPHNMWTAIICLILVSPFFFMAKDLTDLDEVQKSGTGIFLAACAYGIKKVLGA